MEALILPQWPVPGNVKAAITTRVGGFSKDAWRSFNLATHVGDDAGQVAANRRKLEELLALKNSPLWLNQTHSTTVVCADSAAIPAIPEGDGAYSRLPGRVCAVLTADCLPVLLCDGAGSVVAAAHAGWRGLAEGILRSTVNSMGITATELIAYLGPAISREVFEVGAEVKKAFIDNALDEKHRRQISLCFDRPTGKGKFFADLYGLAKAELNALGVTAIYGGDHCTYLEPELFYSYRRDGITGRMASLIWLDP